MWASGPAAAARPVEAGLGPARDGWPPTSALALLVKMAAVAIAATKVQAYSAQAVLRRTWSTWSAVGNLTSRAGDGYSIVFNDVEQCSTSLNTSGEWP